jgi:hypothetical protein
MKDLFFNICIKALNCTNEEDLKYLFYTIVYIYKYGKYKEEEWTNEKSVKNLVKNLKVKNESFNELFNKITF